MKIKKGTILDITSSRKGKYVGVATRDFDVEDEWYPVSVYQDESVYGMSNEWHKGDDIPCRNGIDKIDIHQGVSKFTDVRQFGKDHWSLLAYVETRVVDHKGVLDIRHLSCNPKTHAMYSHSGGWSDEYSTRLKKGVAKGNDDYDCLDDLQHAGYITWKPGKKMKVNIGAMMGKIEVKVPTVKMTKLGSEVNGRLRAHKAAGNNFATFDVEK
jgi:hypothetical protein